MVIDVIKVPWVHRCEAAVSTLVDRLFEDLSESFGEWQAWRRERQSQASLGRMSNYALKDIGIDRSEIVGIVRHKGQGRKQGFNPKHANPGG
jgi:uncharacterized protein YjiS (DUF1127 family)